jgi:glycosyltransferase involved in cell wall biosynthesis
VRIAIEASTWVNPRGYGRFTRGFVRALLSAGSDHCFTLVVDSGAAQAGDLPDVPRVVAATTRTVTAAASAHASRSAPDLWRMGAALSSGSFDAVIFPTVYSFVPVLTGAHLTVVVHDAMPETMPDLVLGSSRARLLWRAKTWMACRRANLVATVSAASAGEIRRHLPLRRGADLLVMTEGVDEAFHAQATDQDDEAIAPFVGPRTPYILYVGGWSPHKRVPALVEAFGQVASRPPHEDLRLVLAGPAATDTFHSDHGAVDHALAALGPLRQRVVVTGFVSDQVLASLYRRAACVVLPSMVEGFGLPALEAMSCGAPLLASRTAAIEELCAGAAEYVDAIEELPDRLQVLLEPGNPRREELRALGPERARHFSWQESARRWLAALPAQVRDRQRAGA